MTRLAFEYPLAWLVGLPLAAIAVGLLMWSLRRQGQPWRRVCMLALLRAAALLVLMVLAARPALIDSGDESHNRNEVALLLDRSESMSLSCGNQSRYDEALELVRKGLLPALKASDIRVKAMLFAEDATAADGRQIAAARPDGKRTNLARAIVRAVAQSDRPPLAVIALTDGANTEDADNARAITALSEYGVPLIGIGCGRETGTQVLSLEDVSAPPVAAPKQEFRVAARLRASGEKELSGFDLLLLRDGQFAQKKSVAAGAGARVWQESFSVTEPEEQLCRYTVQLMPPADPSVKCPATTATAAVRIAGEKECRVLYVQGALTWDYKFIRLAVAADPNIRLSGLSRTANQTAFFESSDNEQDVVGGFPATIEELAKFRVVVISNIRPSDLTAGQQEVLSKFCGQYGGGVLMIGGQDTFDASWQASQLEKLLPVRFAPPRFAAPRFGLAPGPAYRLQVTDAALALPAFRISDADNRACWSRLPTFPQYAAVESVKPGAEVWAASASDPSAVLMACQHYGGGLSAVICVQNFWRWRLAKDSKPEQFDRFWRQLFRHLAEGSRDLVTLTVPDQRLQPNSQIRLVIQRRPDPRASQGAESYRVLVKDDKDQALTDQAVELLPGGTAEVAFLVQRAGLLTASVVDRSQATLTSRSLEISDSGGELACISRNMDSLCQWAGVSGGVALRCEDCRDGGKLVEEIKRRIEQSQRSTSRHVPLGVNGWILALLLACVCGEWSLRKKWGLT
jgi:hypothetical protein